MKRILIFCIAALLAGPVSAQFHSNMQESAENWLSNPQNVSAQGGGRIGEDDGPTADPTVPVGDSLYLILLSAGFYAGFRFSKSRKYTCKSVLQ
jgi:hypothetical protein